MIETTISGISYQLRHRDTPGAVAMLLHVNVKFGKMRK
jgi:hypothetical protein